MWNIIRTRQLPDSHPSISRFALAFQKGLMRIVITDFEGVLLTSEISIDNEMKEHNLKPLKFVG